MERFETYKLPRLYVEDSLAQGQSVFLKESQIHYFKTVLRRQPQDYVRLFNGQHGEYLGSLAFEGKKQGFINILQQIRPQPALQPGRHLYFVLPKKKAFDLIIEKAVELGVTHFHPLTSQNGQIRAIDEARVQQQIIEACEQSERLDVSHFSPLQPLQNIFTNTQNLYAAIELLDAPVLGEAIEKSDPLKPLAFLIGPEGGFTADERAFINKQPGVQTISLGTEILKAETAVFLCLGAAKLHTQKAGIL